MSLTAAIGSAMPTWSTSPAAAQSGPASVTPPHRRHHAVTWDPAAQRVVLYGGQQLRSPTEGSLLDDLWAWDGHGWTEVASGTGTGVIGHRLFADGRGSLYAVGGSRGGSSRWQGGRWTALAPDSADRVEMAAGAWDAERRVYVSFGGHVGGRVFPTDTRVFDGQRWTHLAVGGPGARLGAAMAYDSRRHRTVLFGGLEPGGTRLGDTWEWDGARWTRIPVSGPPGRFGAGLAYDMARSVMVLFGGVGEDDHKRGDTWLWDGLRWVEASPGAGPPSRSEGYLAYDPIRRVVVLFGGEPETVTPTLGDTWEWDGTRWQRRP